MPLSKAKKSEYNKTLYQQKKLGILKESQIPSVTPDVIPWYNSQVHKAGDRVRVNVRGRVQVVTVPSLDADGHPMPF